MKSAFAKTVYGLFALAAIGCAGATVTGQSNSTPASNTRPAQIVVYPFAVSPSEVTLNQGFFQRTYRQVSGEDQTDQRIELAHQTAHNVCVQTAANLTQKGLSATCLDRGVRPSASDALVIDGEFTDISEGNRLRRMVIGLGTGQSTLDTTVVASQNTAEGSQQLMEFSTHADSGSMPGAAIMGAPGAAAGGAAAVASVGVNVAAGGVKNYKSSTGSLADMTVTQIVDQVTKYYGQQGWIS
jgi:hypothetical protein